MANIRVGGTQSVTPGNRSHLRILLATVGLLDLRYTIKSMLAIEILESTFALPVLAAAEKDDKRNGDKANDCDTTKDTANNGTNVGSVIFFLAVLIIGIGCLRGSRR